MQEVSADGGSTGDVSSKIQGLEGIKAGQTPEKQRVIQEAIDALKASVQTKTEVSGVVGKAGAQAAASVQSKVGEVSVDSAQNAIRSGQGSQQKSIDTLIALLQQGGNGLMQSKQSIEQMKAGFSGMLEVVGIVAKHLGADDFGDSCLDLAKKLTPEKVNLDAETKQQIENLIKAVPAYLRPEQWESHIEAGRTGANIEISRQQAEVVRQGNDGIDSVAGLKQPTAQGVIASRGIGGNVPHLTAHMREAISGLISSGEVAGPQGAKVSNLLLKSDTNSDGKLDSAEQRAFGQGAVQLFGQAKAALVNRELGITGAPNAKPLVIAGPTLTPGV